MKRIQKSDQEGMVAIIVTMIMIFVITLIVLGFTQVSRHNQREALDSQLGTQAYYAAESGVNLVARLVNSGTAVPSNYNCTDFAGGVSIPRTLSAANNVQNTCLMVNANPTTMLVDTIAPYTGTTVWDVKDNTAGATFQTLNFEWDPANSPVGTCSYPKGQYPSPGTYTCQYALLRVDIFNPSQVPAGSTLPADLLAATKTVYLQPSGTLVTPALNVTDSAYQGSCDVPSGKCSVGIDVSGYAANEYYVRLTTLYRTALNVKLTASDNVPTALGSVHFANGQIIVDSTGKAVDQVKRIQVRIPPNQATTDLPVFALQSADTICKNLAVKDTIAYYSRGACSAIW